jgi:hypothetical protein
MTKSLLETERTTMPETLQYTLLLSFEQLSENEDDDWLEHATNDEIALIKEQNPGVTFENLRTDKTGRPYAWITVDSSICPTNVLLKASQNFRVFRW